MSASTLADPNRPDGNRGDPASNLVMFVRVSRLSISFHRGRAASNAPRNGGEVWLTGLGGAPLFVRRARSLDGPVDVRWISSL